MKPVIALLTAWRRRRIPPSFSPPPPHLIGDDETFADSSPGLERHLKGGGGISSCPRSTLPPPGSELGWGSGAPWLSPKSLGWGGGDAAAAALGGDFILGRLQVACRGRAEAADSPSWWVVHLRRLKLPPAICRASLPPTGTHTHAASAPSHLRAPHSRWLSGA